MSQVDARTALIDRLNNTDLSGLKSAEERDEQPAAEPQDEIETTDIDDPEEPAEQDDAPEAEPENDDRGQEAVDTLRDEINELREKLESQATTPGGTGASPAGAPAQSASSNAFDKVREKLAKAKSEWGTLVEETGLEDLVNELEPLVERINTLAKDADERRAQETQAKAQQVEQAVASVHQMMDKMAKQSPDLAKLIGTTGTRSTDRELELRKLILQEATIEQERAFRISGGKKLLSDEDALAKAAGIVLKDRTGRNLALRTPDQKAADRARMVRPATGASTATSPNSVEEGRRRAEANVEQYLRNRGG